MGARLLIVCFEFKMMQDSSHIYVLHVMFVLYTCGLYMLRMFTCYVCSVYMCPTCYVCSSCYVRFVYMWPYSRRIGLFLSLCYVYGGAVVDCHE